MYVCVATYVYVCVCTHVRMCMCVCIYTLITQRNIKNHQYKQYNSQQIATNRHSETIMIMNIHWGSRDRFGHVIPQ